MTDTVSVVIPAYNEGASIAPLVSALRLAAAWREIIVVDDGSGDDTGARAAGAGATVIRHPYNKGNGAAVKTGIRNASGTFVLIADGDGQHRPADAARHGWASMIWSSARARAPRRRGRRGGWAT